MLGCNRLAKAKRRANVVALYCAAQQAAEHCEALVERGRFPVGRREVQVVRVRQRSRYARTLAERLGHRQSNATPLVQSRNHIQIPFFWGVRPKEGTGFISLPGKHIVPLNWLWTTHVQLSGAVEVLAFFTPSPGRCRARVTTPPR